MGGASIPEAQQGASDPCKWKALGWVGSLPLLTLGPPSFHSRAWVGGSSPSASLLPLHPLPELGPGSFVGGAGGRFPAWEAALWGPSRLGGAGVPKAGQSAVGAGWPGLMTGSGLSPPPLEVCLGAQQVSTPPVPLTAAPLPPQHAIAFCLKESGSKPPMVMYPPPRGPRSPAPALAAGLAARCYPSPCSRLAPLWLWDPQLHAPSWRKPQASPPSLHDH